MSSKVEVRNSAEVIGEIVKDFEYSFSNHDTEMYRGELAVKRLSGKADIVPVLMPRSLYDTIGDKTRIKVVGTMRTYSQYNEDTGKSKLSIYIFAYDVYEGEDLEDKNEIKLVGNLCKQPIIRETPKGKTICDFMLAVNTTKWHSDYIPCIAWKNFARALDDAEVGAKISLTGRFQSREYTKVIGEEEREVRTAFELSCTTLNIIENGKQEKEKAEDDEDTGDEFDRVLDDEYSGAADDVIDDTEDGDEDAETGSINEDDGYEETDAYGDTSTDDEDAPEMDD